MTVIINGTTGISGVDGSAGTPAVQGSDTNTGVFYPAADTVGVSTGGSERMRVDSSGNVGIGTASPSYKLSVNGSLSYSDARGTNSYLFNSAGNYCGLGFYSDLSLATRYAVLETQIGTSTTLKTDTATPLIFGTNATEVGRFDSAGLFKFNSGYGSVATAYGCRAWINFNGTGTPAIRASGNVSSITDNGVGDYTLNFSTAMPDTNYSFSGGTNGFASTDSGSQVIVVKTDAIGGTATTYTTSAFRFLVGRYGGTVTDSTYNNVMIFR